MKNEIEERGIDRKRVKEVVEEIVLKISNKKSVNEVYPFFHSNTDDLTIKNIADLHSHYKLLVIQLEALNRLTYSIDVNNNNHNHNNNNNNNNNHNNDNINNEEE